MSCRDYVNKYVDELRRMYNNESKLRLCEIDVAYGRRKPKECAGYAEDTSNAQFRVNLSEIDLHYCYERAFNKLNNRVDVLERRTN